MTIGSDLPVLAGLALYKMMVTNVNTVMAGNPETPAAIG